MEKLVKQVAWMFLAIGIITFASCSKDDPTPEPPQEEVAKAKLTFVEVEWHGSHPHDVDNPETVEIEFDRQMSPVGNGHVDLDEGKTYRLILTAYDSDGNEVQDEFVDDADIHQAFLLGAPDGVLDYTYVDAQVGVTGYLHVLEATETGFTFNYVLRHLNVGVKSNITAADWNNPNYTQFGGANDLNLKFDLHIVEGDGHGDH
ncbi:hypothetical protein [Parapedobacter tibetensis]|uniref:hypothetical protein n=1 Tax=Parapedobacter tibetensis TaxID=2972951 RepID=UPI00214D4A36|nr:hypothetical protein [Parapedobacter tibetensis]